MSDAPEPLPLAEWLAQFEPGDACPLCQGFGELIAGPADTDCAACDGFGTIADAGEFVDQALYGDAMHKVAADFAWRRQTEADQHRWIEHQRLTQHQEGDT